MNAPLTHVGLPTLVRMIKSIAMSSQGNIELHKFGAVSLPGHGEVAFDVDLYAYGECFAIQLNRQFDESGDRWHQPFGTLTVNVPDHSLPPGAFFAKLYGENTLFRDPLLTQGWFEDMGDRVPVGATEVEVWRPTMKFVDAFVAAHQKELSVLQEGAIL